MVQCKLRRRERRHMAKPQCTGKQQRMGKQRHMELMRMGRRGFHGSFSRRRVVQSRPRGWDQLWQQVSGRL